VKRALIHVVAGVVSDDRGRILLTQRPPGKHLAGLWEFPGGKCEPGESAVAALRRELGEELGIEIGAAEKLIAVPWHYVEKSIYLDVYNVLTYTGVPHGREGQAVCWVSPDELAAIEMPPADRSVVTALRLPSQYVISPEPDDDHAEFLRRFARVLDAGAKLVQLRSRQLTLPRLRSLVSAAHELATRVGAQLLINGHVDLAQDLALDGVHLSASELMRLQTRPLAAGHWVAASCHDERELEHAAAIDVDFAVLGPVLQTPSHPNAETLGWKRFAGLAVLAPFPVYALGGLGPNDVARARDAGAQGIAGISAFWKH
jgi:8-oxo-dGTP diphosphatase